MSKEIMTVVEWYANEIGKKVDELDEYDLHNCKVAEAYANYKVKAMLPEKRLINSPFGSNIENKGWNACIDQIKQNAGTDECMKCKHLKP